MVDAVILMDQVEIPETGVVTQTLLQPIRSRSEADPQLLVLADSRRGLRDYPRLTFKMNAAELSALVGFKIPWSVDEIGKTAAALAQRQGRPVFVTLAERGLLAAAP